MGKPSGAAVAARAVAAVAEGHTYVEMDCQALIEYAVNACGGRMAFSGSNDMARNALAGRWTLAEAKRAGRLVPGAGLFILETDGGEPQRYKADGLGNFSHVGFYVGAHALTDTDKAGKRRQCDCVHSSATMGRVAGSTLQNGWTHVGWWSAVDYGAEADDGGNGGDAYPSVATAANGAGRAPSKASAAGTGANGVCQSAAGAEANGVCQSAAGTKSGTKSDADTALEVSRFYTVRRGCKGGAVRRLQAWLAELGGDLGRYGADGEFGAATDAAVRLFQARCGLAADGVVGARTWAALAAARSAASALIGETRDAGSGAVNPESPIPETDTAGITAAQTGASEAHSNQKEPDRAATAATPPETAVS